MKNKFKIIDIAVIGIMTAILLAAKVALDFLPNVELVTFLMILYGICFGWRVLCVILFKKTDNVWIWSIFSGIYGLLFGGLYALIYFFAGWREGGAAFGISTAFAKWISGIPFDLTHCIGNFAVMLILYIPIRKTLTRIKKSLSL